MLEQERAFLERLKKMHGEAPFIPMLAMDEFRLSELPPEVRDRLVARGPGQYVTRALLTWLQEEAGAIQTGLRNKHGHFWRLP